MSAGCTTVNIAVVTGYCAAAGTGFGHGQAIGATASSKCSCHDFVARRQRHVAGLTAARAAAATPTREDASACRCFCESESSAGIIGKIGAVASVIASLS